LVTAEKDPRFDALSSTDPNKKLYAAPKIRESELESPN